jgi:hypothetical protein
MTVYQFVQWKPEFNGTATELLGELNRKADELSIERQVLAKRSRCTK